MERRSSRVPIRYRHDYRLRQVQESYGRFRVITLMIAVAASAYLLQYQVAPGVEMASRYSVHYILTFSVMVVLSILFRFMLPYLHRRLDPNVQDHLFFFYTAILLICCSCLTMLDLLVYQANDYTAYAVGVIGLAFFVRASIVRYASLVSGALLFLALNIAFTLEIDNYFGFFLPLIVLSVLGVFVAYLTEKNRREVYLLQLELHEKNEELKTISFKDPLTELYNRRFLMESLSNQIEYFKRTGIQFSIILIDIDHFKKINDQLGHPTGDQALRELAEIMRKGLRTSDIAARFGGEEFIILVPHTLKEGALVAAERIRKATENFSFTGIPWPMTVSIGISEATADDDEESVVERADKMLYRAKSKGRNCCSL